MSIQNVMCFSARLCPSDCCLIETVPRFMLLYQVCRLLSDLHLLVESDTLHCKSKWKAVHTSRVPTGHRPQSEGNVFMQACQSPCLWGGGASQYAHRQGVVYPSMHVGRGCGQEVYTPTTPKTATDVVGMHPTRMHSCSSMIFLTFTMTRCGIQVHRSDSIQGTNCTLPIIISSFFHEFETFRAKIENLKQY